MWLAYSLSWKPGSILKTEMSQPVIYLYIRIQEMNFQNID
jgi:hypothetical protein